MPVPERYRFASARYAARMTLVSRIRVRRWSRVSQLLLAPLDGSCFPQRGWGGSDVDASACTVSSSSAGYTARCAFGDDLPRQPFEQITFNASVGCSSRCRQVELETHLDGKAALPSPCARLTVTMLYREYFFQRQMAAEATDAARHVV